jgi:hypothetical protein
MAQTRTYADLITDIQAKSGVHNGFSTNELTSIKSEVNSRIHELALESDYWENLIVIGEERAVNNSTDVVPYTGGVVDAGKTNPYTSSVDTFLRIHKEEPWRNKDALEYEFAGNASGARLVGYSDTYGLSSSLTSGSPVTVGSDTVISLSGYLDVYVGGTIECSDFETTPVDINGIQTVTAVTHGVTNTLVTIGVTGSGTYTANGDESVKVPVAYCTYKKRISDTTYGDGVGETSDIPFEWFKAIACGVVATLKDGENNFASRDRWEAKYQREIDLQIERLDAQRAAQTVGQVFHTHLSEQGRAVNY